MTSTWALQILAIASAPKTTWAIGLVEPLLGCDVTEASQCGRNQTRLVVIEGRAYRRVVCASGGQRIWRLEPLRLEEAIDWLIRQQEEAIG